MTATNVTGHSAEVPSAEQTTTRAVPSVPEADRLQAMAHEVPVVDVAAAGCNPALLGLPTFIVGALALGLTLTGYVPAAAGALRSSGRSLASGSATPCWCWG